MATRAHLPGLVCFLCPWGGPCVRGLVGWGVLGGGVGLASRAHISMLPSNQHMVRTLLELCCSVVFKNVCILCKGPKNTQSLIAPRLPMGFMITYDRDRYWAWHARPWTPCETYISIVPLGMLIHGVAGEIWSPEGGAHVGGAWQHLGCV